MLTLMTFVNNMDRDQAPRNVHCLILFDIQLIVLLTSDCFA